MKQRGFGLQFDYFNRRPHAQIVPAPSGRAAMRALLRGWRRGALAPKVTLLLSLIIAQAVVAVIIAVVNRKTVGIPASIVLLAIGLVVAAGAREIIREFFSAEGRAARQVRRHGDLLDLLSDRLPSLLRALAEGLTSPVDTHEELLRSLRVQVLHEAQSLAARSDHPRAAYFRRSGDQFETGPDHFGWRQRPTCPQTATGGLILETLNDPEIEKVWTGNIAKERSPSTLAFKLSDECASFVAVPVRAPRELIGFFYLECDRTHVLERREAEVLVVLSQILCAAESVMVGT